MDIWHFWGGDITAAPNGDLATVDGINLGIQRVIRRLMTAQGELIFHPEYGAGLPQRIGPIQDNRVIMAIIRSQIFLEAQVARTPSPTIIVASILNGISVRLKYTDAFAQKKVNVVFPVYARPFQQSQQSGLSSEVPA